MRRQRRASRADQRGEQAGRFHRSSCARQRGLADDARVLIASLLARAPAPRAPSPARRTGRAARARAPRRRSPRPADRASVLARPSARSASASAATWTKHRPIGGTPRRSSRADGGTCGALPQASATARVAPERPRAQRASSAAQRRSGGAIGPRRCGRPARSAARSASAGSTRRTRTRATPCRSMPEQPAPRPATDR